MAEVIVVRMREGSAEAYMEKARRVIALGNETMLALLFGKNPISDAELRALIRKRPEVYGRFSGYVGKQRKGRGR
jgi:hypothetical protein